LARKGAIIRIAPKSSCLTIIMIINDANILHSKFGNFEYQSVGDNIITNVNK